MINWRGCLCGITNLALLIAGLANLAIGSYFALRSSVGIAATSLTAGLVLLFAATIDRFESLKGLGIEAKTRKLDSKIQQADEALDRLREFAELTSAVVINYGTKIGRWSEAPTANESYDLAQRTHTILAGLESKPDQIREILEPWALMMCGDLGAALTRELGMAIDRRSEELHKQRAQRMRTNQPLMPDDPDMASTAAEIEQLALYRKQRLVTHGMLALSDYPNELLRIIDEAPLADRALIDAVRTKTERFSASMTSLRTKFKITNAKRRQEWFDEVQISLAK